MAIMSSGKSSSRAAVLLLVAVVVAATCTSGAQAAFDILNNCIYPVTIVTASPSQNTLLHGGSLHVPGSPNTFFNNPVTITIIRLPSVTDTVRPGSLVLLNQMDDRLHEVVITCDGTTNCVTLTATYTPLLSPPGTISTLVLGPFCP